MEKILGLVSDILLIVSTFIIMIFSILAVKNYQMNNQLIEEYMVNWNSGPIMDIIATNQNVCPPGYSNFLLGEYPGSTDGCNCMNSDRDKYKNQIFNFTCTRKMIVYNCSMVFSTPTVNYTKWRGKKLCAIRDTTNFWKLEFISSDKACPNGKKPCGALDSFNNVMCVNNNFPCPINALDILPNNQLPSYSNANKIKLNDNYNLFFANVNDSTKPIVVNVYPREEICAHPFEGRLGENEYPLNLMKGPSKCVTSVNGFLTDTRFQKVDTQMLINFFNENNITSTVEKLPHYPHPTPNQVVLLNKINYFGWNRKCFDNPAFKINSSNSTDMSNPSIVNTYYRKTYTLGVFAILNFVYVFTFILLYKMIIASYSITHKAIIFIDVINLIFFSVVFGLSVSVISNTNFIISPYRTFIDLACGDQITNGIIQLSFGEIIKSVNYLKPVMILSFIEIVLLIAYYIYYIYQVREIMHLKRH